MIQDGWTILSTGAVTTFLPIGREHPEAAPAEHGEEQDEEQRQASGTQAHHAGLVRRDWYRWQSSWRPPWQAARRRRPLRAVLAIVGAGNRAQAFPARDRHHFGRLADAHAQLQGRGQLVENHHVEILPGIDQLRAVDPDQRAPGGRCVKSVTSG